MKIYKTLILVFMVTLLTSAFGVFAYGTGALYISNESVPGFNGSWYSDGRTKNMAGDQTVTNVSTQRSLDMQLQYYNTVTNSWLSGAAWYILNTGNNVTFLSEGPVSYYPSLMLADYRLHVDSRITYINSTKIYSATYNPGN